MASKPYIKWDKFIAELVDLLGVNTPVTTSRTEIASTLGVSTGSFDRCSRTLRSLGLLKSRATSGGQRADGTPIRSQEFTLTADAKTILETVKAHRMEFGDVYEAPATRTDDFGDVQRRQHEINEPEPHLEELEDEPVFSTGEAPTDNPFAVLKPLKRNEAAALIESARQYQGKRSFIDEEIAKFAEHGLTLDPASVGFPTDERLETIGLVVDYVTRLENENARLQSYANEANRTASDDRELRLQIARQKEQLNRLVSERAEQNAAVQRLQNQWSGKEGTYMRRIEDLEQKLFDARRVNGAAQAQNL